MRRRSLFAAFAGLLAPKPATPSVAIAADVQAGAVAFGEVARMEETGMAALHAQIAALRAEVAAIRAATTVTVDDLVLPRVGGCWHLPVTREQVQAARAKRDAEELAGAALRNPVYQREATPDLAVDSAAAAPAGNLPPLAALALRSASISMLDHSLAPPAVCLAQAIASPSISDSAAISARSSASSEPTIESPMGGVATAMVEGGRRGRNDLVARSAHRGEA